MSYGGVLKIMELLQAIGVVKMGIYGERGDLLFVGLGYQF